MLLVSSFGGTLDITLFGIGSGHFVKLSEPIGSVVTDPEVAYALLVNSSVEMGEIGFARRHKRFFIEEWGHFISLFPA